MFYPSIQKNRLETAYIPRKSARLIKSAGKSMNQLQYIESFGYCDGGNTDGALYDCMKWISCQDTQQTYFFFNSSINQHSESQNKIFITLINCFIDLIIYDQIITINLNYKTLLALVNEQAQGEYNGNCELLHRVIGHWFTLRIFEKAHLNARTSQHKLSGHHGERL